MPYTQKTPLKFAHLLSLSALFACAESEISSGGDTAWSEDIISTGLRVDIYPSDSLGGVLPQSFRIEDGASWSNVELLLQPSVEIKGAVQGYSTYPTIDIVLPGELVSVEAQLQLQQK